MIFSLLFLNGKTQIIFETQQQVDSFVVVMDTSINNYYHFYYDDLLPESERITDLSGFDEDGWMFIKLFYFEIEDMPWFKSFHQGQIHFVNMPNLKTFSGLKNVDYSIFGINNCPSLKSFPPSSFLKHNGELWITNQDIEQFELNFKDVAYKERATFNKVKLYDNNITRLIINDPNGAASNTSIRTDSSMRYLEMNSASYQIIDIKDNLLLDSIRGFKKADTIVGRVTGNPNLSDLCAMRYGWDNRYQWLPQQSKDLFNSSQIGGNGSGANTYEEMMATDCSWLADTFTTVAEQKDVSKLRLYPNPVSRGVGSVSLEIGDEKTISTLQITNLQGQPIYSSINKVSQSMEIDISSFSVGIYTVLLLDNEGTLFTRKLVVVE